MNNKIIDSPYELVKKSEDELIEILLDPKYNHPNLIELVRRCLMELKDYMDRAKYLEKKNDVMYDIIMSGNSWNEEIAKMQRKLQDL